MNQSKSSSIRVYRKCSKQLKAKIDKLAQELFDKEPFNPNPFTRAGIADACMEKACKQYGVRPSPVEAT